jgi:hypothetical protein
MKKEARPLRDCMLGADVLAPSIASFIYTAVDKQTMGPASWLLCARMAGEQLKFIA